ncbi:hypothetical protein ACFSQ7_50240 [Paenibacillus rhizoplanae]
MEEQQNKVWYSPLCGSSYTAMLAIDTMKVQAAGAKGSGNLKRYRANPPGKRRDPGGADTGPSGHSVLVPGISVQVAD